MVCRVFKKKNHINRGFQAAENIDCQEERVPYYTNMKASGSAPVVLVEPKQNHHHHHLQSLHDYGSTSFDGFMHLPQLFSPDHHQTTSSAPSFISNLNTMDIECSQNLLRLTSTTTSTSTAGSSCGLVVPQQQRFNGDWSFLDKLLASHHSLHDHDQDHHHHPQTKSNPSISQIINNNIAHQPHDHDDVGSSAHYRFPFQYLGCCDSTHHDILKFCSK